MKSFFVILICFTTSLSYAQNNQKIDQAKYKEFDFWIGEWTVYKYGTDSIAGHSKIESIIDGVGLLENYHVPNGGYKGKSLNKYNPVKSQWEQNWIDNSGLTLHLVGGLQGDKMVMDDTANADKANGLNRIEWTPESKNVVRQTWSTSADGGSIWIVVFDGIYKRKKGTES